MRQSLFACILAMLSLLLPACDVHEFPEPPLPPRGVEPQTPL